MWLTASSCRSPDGLEGIQRPTPKRKVTSGWLRKATGEKKQRGRVGWGVSDAPGRPRAGYDLESQPSLGTPTLWWRSRMAKGLAEEDGGFFTRLSSRFFSGLFKEEEGTPDRLALVLVPSQIAGDCIWRPWLRGRLPSVTGRRLASCSVAESQPVTQLLCIRCEPFVRGDRCFTVTPGSRSGPQRTLSL